MEPLPSPSRLAVGLLSTGVVLLGLALATRHLSSGSRPARAQAAHRTSGAEEAGAVRGGLRVFNAQSGVGVATAAGLRRGGGGGVEKEEEEEEEEGGGVAATRLDADAGTNRTLWAAVRSREFHSGLQRVEVGARIPAHRHGSEEVIVIVGGRGKVARRTAGEKGEEGEIEEEIEVTTGSMIHVERGTVHEIRNCGDEVLWLAWIFPVLDSDSEFKFAQSYGKG